MVQPHSSLQFHLPPTAASSSTITRNKRPNQGLDLSTKKQRHDRSVGSLSADAKIEDILAHVNLWASVSFDQQVRNERARTFRVFKNWLNNTNTLKLHWNALPNIFHTHYIQHHLTKLAIKCPKGYVKNGNLLDLPELLGNLGHLKMLEVSGAGLKVVADSLALLKKLEVFKLDNTQEENLPESISELPHLTTLVLHKNANLEQLPLALTRLPNLKTLSIQDCARFIHLPNFTGGFNALTSLLLTRCPGISYLPPSIQETRIEFLAIDSCLNINELPESIGRLKTLKSLSLHNTSITNLPVSLYRLALEKPEGFLPKPWKSHVTWMKAAVSNSLSADQRAYKRIDHHFYITIYAETLVPYAQEHLELLTRQVLFNINPAMTESEIKYRKNPAIDVGGLSRHFWSAIIPSLAKMLQQIDDNPLLTELPNGNFQLSLDVSREMTETEQALCRNIGRLFTLFLSGLSKKNKLGTCFPLYFYVGIIDLNTRYFYGREENSEEVCYSMARADEEGSKIVLSDEEGTKIGYDLLFNLPQEISEIEIWADEELRRVWKILNISASAEQLRLYFPSLHHFIEDDLFDENVDTSGYHVLNDLQSTGFKEFAALLRASFSEERIAFIQSTLLKYAHTCYHLRYVPLVAVARHCTGFQDQPVGNQREQLTDCLTPFLPLTRNEELLEKAKMLSQELQGASFTVQSFHALIERSRNNTQTLVPANILPILSWYQKEASEVQMKELVRCFTGSEIISSNMILEFRSPVLIGPDQNTLAPLSVFHSCFRSVNVGNDILTHQIKTQKQVTKLINLWQQHVQWALASGFSER